MRVYVAGPYTKDDPAINVGLALQAADALVERGHVPYIPHLSHFWHFYTPRPYQFWIGYALHWLAQCEAVLRLPGESPGSDKEVAWAEDKGLPVYWSVEEVPVAH